jgi:hypothetical protein
LAAQGDHARSILRCMLLTAHQVVEALTQGGPAEASENVRTGDVLESIDGSPVAKMTDRTFPNVLASALGFFAHVPFALFAVVAYDVTVIDKCGECLA